MRSAKFVAVGLLSQRDLDILGKGFRTAFPINKTTLFDDLTIAIDRAESQTAGAMNNSLQPG